MLTFARQGLTLALAFLNEVNPAVSLPGNVQACKWVDFPQPLNQNAA